MTELYPLAVLEPVADYFAFDAVDRICVGVPTRRFLHGGVLFAAAVEALERVTRSPAIQVAIQFLSTGRPGERIALQTEIVAAGKSIQQATLVATAGERIVAIVQGSFGRRARGIEYGVRMPDVASWEHSEPRDSTRLLSSRIEQLYELRLAAGELPQSSAWRGKGGVTTAIWMQSRGGEPVGRQLQAVICDFAPIALHGALGRLASGNSIDNSIRYVADQAPTRVLCMIKIAGVADGLAHANIQLFSPEGALLAIGSQSLILRLWERL